MASHIYGVYWIKNGDTARLDAKGGNMSKSWKIIIAVLVMAIVLIVMGAFK